MIKKSITSSVVIGGVLIGLLGILFLGYLWVIFFESKKFLKDEFNNRKLIEYWDMDTNDLRLKLIEGGESRWIKHPECCMKYEGHILSNTIKFDRNKSDILIVNGKAFKIEEKN